MHDIDPLSTAAAAERLRALPEATVEPYGWQEFKRRASGATWGVSHTGTSSALGFKAAAAMLLVCGAAALAAWIWSQSAPPPSQAVDAGTASSTGVETGAPAHPSDQMDPRARAMEVWLARRPADPAMVRVGSYAAVAGLEDRIAQLDDLLTTARAEGVVSANLSPLEKQRDRLMGSLAQVRYAQTLVAASPP